MQKKVCFITSSHLPFDDRIFYHQAKTLINNGYLVKIICSTQHINITENAIEIAGFDSLSISKTEKIWLFQQHLTNFQPQIIICSEPLPILSAVKYNKSAIYKSKILFDITEWYPSKKNLTPYKHFHKLLIFFKLLFFNIYTSSKSDGFIFGEYYKSIPYKLLFPFKNKTIVSYYPSNEYITHGNIQQQPNFICLGYSGKLNEEKGIFNFLNVAQSLTKLRPELKLKLKIIGKFTSESDKKLFEKQADKLINTETELIDYQKFTNLSIILKDIHLFFDLRSTDFENQHCLPIKLFFYAACGRPVIYSKLKAISKDIDISSFGYLVNPTQSESIAAIVLKYIDNPNLFDTHCQNARKIFESKYNWSNIEPKFLTFIHSFNK